MTHSEKARDYFLKGFNCSQSVFAAFSDVTGLDESTSLKLSASFGGGIGHMREVCGACSGIFMVLGMLYGNDFADDEAKKAQYELTQYAAGLFKDKYESIICRDLLGALEAGKCTLPTPQKRDEEYYKTRPCLIFVEEAARITDKIISEKNQK